MKKIFVALLSGCLILGGFTGCGSSQIEAEEAAGIETADEEKTLSHYPDSTIWLMEDVDDAIEAPAFLYSGQTEEDLEGTTYKFIGEVTVSKSIEEVDNNLPYYIVETKNGDVIIANGAYIYAKDIKDLEDFDSEMFFEFWTAMPKVGEYVCVYADYYGYNEVDNAVVAIYNEDCIIKAMAKCYASAQDTDTTSTVEAGDEFSFTAGNYYVGEDIPAGRYDVMRISGRGNCFAGGMIETFGDSSSTIQSYSNLDLKAGDKIEVSGSLNIKFTAK